MTRLEKISTWIQLIVGIVALFIALISLKCSKDSIDISVNALNNANKQYKQDSISSDIIFNLQLANAKKLNDSLINQIKQLQKITDNQLNVTNESLKQQIFDGNPVLKWDESIVTAQTSNEKDYTITIETTIQNEGKRIAYNIKANTYIFMGNNPELFKKSDNIISIYPPSYHNLQFIIVTNVSNIESFICCLELKYYDLLSKQNLRNIFFLKYTAQDGIKECTNELEENAMKKRFNIELKKLNRPLFN